MTTALDVSGELVHISLTGLPNSPYKEQLLAIRTGLTLRREDVDLLIEAGRSGVIHSAPLHEFLSDYPRAPALAVSKPAPAIG